MTNVEINVTAAVFQEGPVWVVQVPSATGVQRYQCPDEKQARRLEALFAAPPKVQPLRRPS